MPMGWLRRQLRPIAPAVGAAALTIALVALILSAMPASRAVVAAEVSRPASGVHLIMFEDPGCPYCARWEQEVGIAYAASAEGRFAPLVRRHRGHPDVSRFKDIIYSPTFIIARDGVEIGRIVGYPGPDFFWGLLGKLLARAGFRPQADAS